MKNKAKVMAVAAAALLLAAGCATKGGWPCWAWQKNTDQKNERWAEQQLQSTNNYEK